VTTRLTFEQSTGDHQGCPPSNFLYHLPFPYVNAPYSHKQPNGAHSRKVTELDNKLFTFYEHQRSLSMFMRVTTTQYYVLNKSGPNYQDISLKIQIFPPHLSFSPKIDISTSRYKTKTLYEIFIFPSVLHVRQLILVYLVTLMPCTKFCYLSTTSFL